MIVNTELIDSLTKEETIRILYEMSIKQTMYHPIYGDYYNDMISSNSKIKFKLQEKAGFPNQIRNIPVISIMRHHRTRRHSDNNWKWENSVHPDSWDIFYNELVAIVRDRNLNFILDR